MKLTRGQETTQAVTYAKAWAEGTRVTFGEWLQQRCPEYSPTPQQYADMFELSLEIVRTFYGGLAGVKLAEFNGFI